MTRGKTALALLLLLLLLPVSENTTVKGKVGCAWLGWAVLGWGPGFRPLVVATSPWWSTSGLGWESVRWNAASPAAQPRLPYMVNVQGRVGRGGAACVV